MINKKRALPVGVLVVGLLVVLAGMAIVSGLWSKNLVINGSVDTGDVNVDWLTPPCGDRNPWNPPIGTGVTEPGEYLGKDVGWTDAVVDPDDNQILNIRVHNAYPSYFVDCELEWHNTGSIPVNFAGYAYTWGPNLSNCHQQLAGGGTALFCDELTAVILNDIGQVDPGELVTRSFKLHVEQPAHQSDCSATGEGNPWNIGTQNPSSADNANGLSCRSITSYEFGLKLCVNQWNEAATYEQCIQSPQHEGPTTDTIIDADGFASPLDGLPGAQEVVTGDPLHPFPNSGAAQRCGLDFFDNGTLGSWTFGPNGDDLHCERPEVCPTADGTPVHNAGDCVVLDINGDLAVGRPVDCDLDLTLPDPGGTGSGAVCPTGLTFHDTNGNGVYDSGEDIVFDANNDGVFD